MQYDRYQLRLLTENDSIDFYRMIQSNLHRLEFFSGTVGRTKTPEQTEEYVQEIMSKIKDRIYYPYVIMDNSSKKMIGLIDLKNIDWNIPKGELGCFIDEKFANLKISSQLMRLFIDHTFNNMGLVKVFLRTHTLNAPARKLAENCGFKIEGIIRSDYKTGKGQLVDLVYYGLLKEDLLK